MRKILIFFGTRSKTIKIPTRIKEFQKNTNHFEEKVCATTQYCEILDVKIDLNSSGVIK
jgi:UDP-N-acetylglucosamine 2-epimerase (non-hydrolysing)